MITLNLNGYTDIPNGKVANVATFLEMSRKQEQDEIIRNDLTLFHMETADIERYLALFKAVGENWLWFSRLSISKSDVETLIQNPNFEIFIVQQNDKDLGLLELDITNKKNIELAYFGLTEQAIGKGIGTWLMQQAINRTFEHHQANRFFMHTCTMDSPQALTFYMKLGFKPYKRAIEIADDPRLSGHIAAHFGAHHPIIK